MIVSIPGEGKVNVYNANGVLLILHKNEAGVKYREISDLDIFSDLSFPSFQRLYRICEHRKKKMKLIKMMAKTFDHFLAPAPVFLGYVAPKDMLEGK